MPFPRYIQTSSYDIISSILFFFPKHFSSASVNNFHETITFFRSEQTPNFTQFQIYRSNYCHKPATWTYLARIKSYLNVTFRNTTRECQIAPNHKTSDSPPGRFSATSLLPEQVFRYPPYLQAFPTIQQTRTFSHCPDKWHRDGRLVGSPH
jgi:hypothetical protein